MRKRPFVKAASHAGLLLGYARVSKGDEQSNALQAKALRAAGCRRIFEETASGGRWDRPELHRMLDQLREGDIVVVWKLDRLSRSLKDVLHIMERIADAGAGFRSITENIDTTTPAGRMMMQMVGSFAEFERAMIRERTSAGLAAARAEGRIGGRRKKLDAAKRREIAESVISGRKTGAEMARLYNISQPTVSRIVAQHRVASHSCAGTRERNRLCLSPRSLLLGCLLRRDDAAAGRNCWQPTRTKWSACWLYTRALVAFREGHAAERSTGTGLAPDAGCSRVTKQTCCRLAKEAARVPDCPLTRLSVQFWTNRAATP